MYAYTTICKWSFELPLPLGFCESCCNARGCASMSSRGCFPLFRVRTQKWESLGHTVIPFVISRGAAILFPTGAAPFCTPINSEREFQFLHTFANACYFLFFCCCCYCPCLFVLIAVILTGVRQCIIVINPLALCTLKSLLSVRHRRRAEFHRASQADHPAATQPRLHLTSHRRGGGYVRYSLSQRMGSIKEREGHWAQGVDLRSE